MYPLKFHHVVSREDHGWEHASIMQGVVGPLAGESLEEHA